MTWHGLYTLYTAQSKYPSLTLPYLHWFSCFVTCKERERERRAFNHKSQVSPSFMAQISMHMHAVATHLISFISLLLDPILDPHNKWWYDLESLPALLRTVRCKSDDSCRINRSIGQTLRRGKVIKQWGFSFIVHFSRPID